MRFGLAFLVTCVSLVWFDGTARAILIETGAKRIAGYVESEDANKISIRIKGLDGKERITTFDKFRIKIIHQVDRARLEKLNKEKPKTYQDYADELAKHTADPEAIETALRLYLIAAYLDPAKSGRVCLLNMSALATRPADVRKYRALAFLIDAKADAGLLKVEAKAAGKVNSPESKAALRALTEFQKALKYYRIGDYKRAKDYSNEKGVAELFPKAGIKDQKSFLQACSDADCSKCKAGAATCSVCSGKKVVADPFGMLTQPCTECNGKGTVKCSSCDGFGHSPIPDDYLRSILKAEIWAIDQTLPPDPNSKASVVGGWGDGARNPRPSIPLLTLETISEFDPRQCVYRSGAWQAP